MLRMGELVNEEYNIEYASTVRLEELLSPDRDQSESSDESRINNLSGNESSGEE